MRSPAIPTIVNGPRQRFEHHEPVRRRSIGKHRPRPGGGEDPDAEAERTQERIVETEHILPTQCPAPQRRVGEGKATVDEEHGAERPPQERGPRRGERALIEARHALRPHAELSAVGVAIALEKSPSHLLGNDAAEAQVFAFVRRWRGSGGVLRACSGSHTLAGKRFSTGRQMTNTRDERARLARRVTNAPPARWPGGGTIDNWPYGGGRPLVQRPSRANAERNTSIDGPPASAHAKRSPTTTSPTTSPFRKTVGDAYPRKRAGTAASLVSHSRHSAGAPMLPSASRSLARTLAACAQPRKKTRSISRAGRMLATAASASRRHATPRSSPTPPASPAPVPRRRTPPCAV